MPPLGNSDHVLLQLSLKYPSLQNQDSPFHRTTYDYNGADWDSFRAFIRDIPLSDGFCSLPASTCAAELAEWIQIGIDEYIPHRRYQLKPHSAPWYSSDCAAAIADRNRHFHRYRRNECPDTLRAFSISRNKCKKVFNKAKKRYQKSVKSRVAEQNFGSRDFWKIINSVQRPE